MESFLVLLMFKTCNPHSYVIQLEIALKSFFNYRISKSESISENRNLELNTWKGMKGFL